MTDGTSRSAEGRPTASGWASLFVVLASALVFVAAAARRNNVPPESPDSTASAKASGQASPPPLTPSPSASAAFTPPAEGQPELGCTIQDRGMGNFGAPVRLAGGAQLTVEQPAPTSRYDLLLHMHGGAAARLVVAPKQLGLVMASVDLGVGSQAYADGFSAPNALETLLEEVHSRLKPARLDHLILSSWSAGYGGLRAILQRHPTAASAVVLLDSLHAGYEPDQESLVTAGLTPFLSFARRAVAKETVMVLTHSEITPPGYASTSEVANFMLKELEGQRRYGGLEPGYGVEFKTRFKRGQLYVRGYTGSGKPAHCAHLRMLGDILVQEVLPALEGMNSATPRP